MAISMTGFGAADAQWETWSCQVEIRSVNQRFLDIRCRLPLGFQTMEPDSSRIVWLVVLEKRLYVISGYMNTGYGKIWKQWPHHLVADDRVIVRVDNKLYEQRMARMMEHPQLLDLMTINAKKYGDGTVPTFTAEQLSERISLGDFWLFEVVDRET